MGAHVVVAVSSRALTSWPLGRAAVPWFNHRPRPEESSVQLRIGYKASAEQFAPRELVELGVLAEAAGMDTAVVSDHFQPWRHNGGHAPFSLAWLTAVGERTSSILPGTSVMTP